MRAGKVELEAYWPLELILAGLSQVRVLDDQIGTKSASAQRSTSLPPASPTRGDKKPRPINAPANLLTRYPRKAGLLIAA